MFDDPLLLALLSFRGGAAASTSSCALVQAVPQVRLLPLGEDEVWVLPSTTRRFWKLPADVSSTRHSGDGLAIVRDVPAYVFDRLPVLPNIVIDFEASIHPVFLEAMRASVCYYDAPPAVMQGQQVTFTAFLSPVLGHPNRYRLCARLRHLCSSSKSATRFYVQLYVPGFAPVASREFQIVSRVPLEFSGNKQAMRECVPEGEVGRPRPYLATTRTTVPMFDLAVLVGVEKEKEKGAVVADVEEKKKDEVVEKEEDSEKGATIVEKAKEMEQEKESVVVEKEKEKEKETRTETETRDTKGKRKSEVVPRDVGKRRRGQAPDPPVLEVDPLAWVDWARANDLSIEAQQQVQAIRALQLPGTKAACLMYFGEAVARGLCERSVLRDIKQGT